MYSNRKESLSIPVHKQVLHMSHYYPMFHTRMSKRKLVTDGEITPLAWSESYQFHLTYTLGHPVVHIRSPILRPLVPGGPLPHVYPGNRLCLYMPGEGEFDSTMWLADTIIPWTASWLMYYELWHATGEWMGGGHEPGNDGKKEE